MYDYVYSSATIVLLWAAFDFQNSKYMIEKYRTEQGKTRPDKIAW
jgi:hypothetical protein